MTRILLALAVISCGAASPPAPIVRPEPLPDAPPTDAAVVTASSSQRVLVVSTGTMLEAALLVHDGIEVTSLTPADYERDRSVATNVDVIIFDGYAPPELPGPPVDLMLFQPIGSRGPIATRGEVTRPRITDTDLHPLMDDIDMSNVVIARSMVFVVDARRGETALARAGRDAIIAVRDEGRRNVIAFGFPLDGHTTDLTLRTAFPLLLTRSLEWFSRD